MKHQSLDSTHPDYYIMDAKIKEIGKLLSAVHDTLTLSKKVQFEATHYLKQIKCSQKDAIKIHMRSLIKPKCDKNESSQPSQLKGSMLI